MDLMTRRRALLARVESGGRLPAEYQEVEYIESNGTQWIDTGIVPNESTKAQMKLINVERTGNVIFGFYNGEYRSWRFFNDVINGMYVDLPTGANSNYRYNTFNVFYTGTLFEIEIGNHYYKDLISGQTYGRDADTFAAAPTKTLTLNLYRPVSGSDKFSSNRWYWVKIYNNNTIIFDGIPVYRKADSKTGMYDLVSRTFKENAGTGEFIVGADIN